MRRRSLRSDGPAPSTSADTSLGGEGREPGGLGVSARRASRTPARGPASVAAMTSPRLAVYPGTFDPITLGHVDVVTRACTVFDEVVLGVAHNAAKAGRHLFDIDTRLELACSSLAHLPGVSVEVVPGLLADFCRERGAIAIVKGLRNATDLDAEVPMALLNRDLGGPETVFRMAAPAHAHVSSSLVKDVAGHGGDVSRLVSPLVDEALRRALTVGESSSDPRTTAPTLSSVERNHP